jgi:glyoxylase I family protein
MPAISGAHHVAFTVTDLERSATWYGELFGMEPLLGGDGDDVSYVVLAHPPSGWLVGLRRYHDRPHDGFDEFRTGLDHLAFTVSSRDELEAWVPELERRGVEFSPIAETPIGTVIVLRDPDGIQLELWLPLGDG